MMNSNMNKPITCRGFPENVMLAVAVTSTLPVWAQEKTTGSSVTQPPQQSITVGVVQQAQEKALGANRDKIVRIIGQAKARGCCLVIFP